MANLSGAIERIKPHEFSSTKNVVFDWVIVILGLWMVGGFHLDAWAHHRFKIETFLTPWHVILYSGYMTLTVLLLATFIRNLLRGAVWREAMPAGYGLSLIGAALFIAGGLGDLPWHTAFGLEIGIAALLSPTHLLLVYGSALLVTGPLRAAWMRPLDASQRWVSLMPALLSLALLLAGLSFFTSYSHPLSDTILATGHRPFTDSQVANYLGAGIGAILLQSELMMGIILLAVRRWRLPIGGLTLIIAIAYGLAVAIHENFILVPFEILAGLSAEVLYIWLKPSSSRPIPFRWFAFGVPVIFHAFYFLALALTNGVWWAIHLWAGAILMSGIAGWLLSYAFVSPQITDYQMKV